MGENEAEPRQTFLSKLRQRSAIIFTIGLAISVASFVENLHMGRDAIDYLWHQLAQIHAIEDLVRTTAAALHGALEWWRVEVVQRLLKLLNVDIPVWLHDPLSLLFFASARVVSAISRKVAGVDDPVEMDLEPGERIESVGYFDDESGRYARYTRYLVWAIRARHVLVFYVAPLTFLMVLDRNFYNLAAHRFDFARPLTQLEVIFYSLLLILLLVALLLLAARMTSARKAAMNALPRNEDGTIKVTRKVRIGRWI